MAYFISKEKRFMSEVENALRVYFGGFASIENRDGGLDIEIERGYDRAIDRLTPQELEDGVIGGGFIEGLNGECFRLILKKEAN